MTIFEKQKRKAEALISSRGENPADYSFDRINHAGGNPARQFKRAYDVEVSVNRLHVGPVKYKNAHVLDWVSLFTADLNESRFVPRT